MSAEIEVWRAVPLSMLLGQAERLLVVKEFLSEFMASSLGRVRDRHGEIIPAKPAKKGYLKCEVFERMVPTHRIICGAFHGPPADWSLEVNHKDGIKTNNRPTNLEWMTTLENMAHARAHGLVAQVSKPIHAIDPATGETAFSFPSIMAASRHFGIDDNKFYLPLRFPHRKCGGFYWRFTFT